MKSLPPEVERRRRLVTRTLPLAIIAVVAFVVGAVHGRARLAREGSRRALRRGLGGRRLRRDVPGAEPGLAAARSSINDFVIAYRDAERGGDPARARRRLAGGRLRGRARSTVVPVQVDADTVAFGLVEGDLELPFDEGGIAWDPSLVFPGLRRGEQPREPDRAGAAGADPRRRRHRRWPRARPKPANTRWAAPRSTSPAKSATAEEEDLAALARQGFSADTPVGVSGLEQAFNARLAGKPGGSLLAVADDGGSARILAKAQAAGRARR